MQEIEKEIDAVDLSGYDKDISYCGSWNLNEVRSKIGVQRLLPFNRICYLHDKGYYILTKHFHNLSLLELLKYKFKIDYKFLQDMRNSDEDYNIILKEVTSALFFTIVILMTPIYYFKVFKK